MDMKKGYNQLQALNLMERMKKGESLQKLSNETGIAKSTLWRWREGKSFPQRGHENSHEYYEEHRKEIIERIKRNRYSGKYFAILQRDNNQCQVCYETIRLHIHHIDGDKENNNDDNLITLCKRCHRMVHLASLILEKIPPYTRIRRLAEKIKY